VKTAADPRRIGGCRLRVSGGDGSVDRLGQREPLLADLVLGELVRARADLVLAPGAEPPQLVPLAGGERGGLGVEALADQRVELGAAGQERLGLVVVGGVRGLRVVDVADLDRAELG
jgi:hypothetical protein